MKRSTEWLCVGVLGVVALAYFTCWGLWVARRHAVEADRDAFQRWDVLAGCLIVLYMLLAAVFAVVKERKK